MVMFPGYYFKNDLYIRIKSRDPGFIKIILGLKPHFVATLLKYYLIFQQIRYFPIFIGNASCHLYPLVVTPPI